MLTATTGEHSVHPVPFQGPQPKVILKRERDIVPDNLSAPAITYFKLSPKSSGEQRRVYPCRNVGVASRNVAECLLTSAPITFASSGLQ